MLTTNNKVNLETIKLTDEIREADGTLVITTNDAPAGMGNHPAWYYEDLE